MIQLVPLLLFVLPFSDAVAAMSGPEARVGAVPRVASLEADLAPRVALSTELSLTGVSTTRSSTSARAASDPREDDGMSPPLVGALVGGGTGLGAGLLFVHDACNDDPCHTFAYVLGAATGAAALGLSGALLGSRARLPQPARRNAWIGSAIGGAVGATGAVILMAATCDGDCGPAGYVSFPFATAGVLAAIGGFVGSLFGR